MNINEVDIASIVSEVLLKIQNHQAVDKTAELPAGENGIFVDMNTAVEAADSAQKELAKLSLKKRDEIVEAMRQAALSNAREIGRMSVLETGMGKIEDKIAKNIAAARNTPGIEDITTKAFTGDFGLTLVENAPYGVIGAITPSTNPSETVICNGIGMIAGGNAAVFNSHPGAKKVTKYTIQLLNKAIVGVGGPPNLLCGVEEPTIETGNILMSHPKVKLLVVTGGPQIVQIAMRSGKKAIAAGPGNPPVIVDQTADLEKAARYIVDGASFDNNIICAAEKEIFVVREAADRLLSEMIKHGAYLLTEQQLEQLMPVISVNNKDKLMPNKKYIGKDVQVILQAIGLNVEAECKIAVAIVPKNHPLVYMEQLMPVIPLALVKDVDEAIEEACKAEQNNFHTAVMHSTCVDNLSKAARILNTSIFVKNGPSYAGLGITGEGFTTFSIACATGEGLTSAVNFTRQRRCVLKDQFRIV